MNSLPKATHSIPGAVYGVVSTDILEDILVDLAKENEERLANLSEYAGSFKHQKVIELVFLLSELWCQDSSTKYQAVEILDRFMILHIEEMYNSTAESKKEVEASHCRTWNSIKSSLCDTFMLRIVSCVQIASKLYFHCHIINNNAVLQFLKSAGCTYNKVEVLESELTVLKTLKFRINHLSPFTYVEMLLEVLGHNGSTVSLKDFRDMCIKVMDLVYLLRNPIYDMLLKASVDLSTPSDLQRTKFVSVKEDQMLLATGVIATSAYILIQGSWNEVLDHLQCITGITVSSTFEISSVILKQCVGVTDLIK
ncbi:cyclin N-terminal domain-containing protein 1 [Bombina bombina]|uniref:cyclin N-terminal domain-containing protein 1 n=1 Tax=Bombina bombina TaxID=8345 RepID=UPI00235AA2C1|nr:cyclin N-terminal domain-containing protein 1 [Bombina bombina]